MKRWWFVALGAVLVLGGVIAWFVLPRDEAPRRRHVASRRLDVAAFRSYVEKRLQRAKTVVPPPPTRRSAPPRSTGLWKYFGKGPAPNSGTQLIEPECTLGPRELCTTLEPLVRGCDAGDASDCLAVGQFLADTPPRGIVSITFFIQACRIGDPAGCERIDELRSPTQSECEADPFACSYTAMRTHNLALHEQACSFGAGDSCSFASFELRREDPEASQAYLEQACQFGLSMACASLARRLDPSCAPDENEPCFPPNPVQSKAALEIGCAAGWSDQEPCPQP